MPTTTLNGKRLELVRTAIRLFGEKGFHATGIDLIAAEAGVSKKTMYTYFRSKEALIAEALRYHDGEFRRFFTASVRAIPGSGTDRLLGIFDVAYAWFKQSDFFGCLFINAAGEFGDEASEIRQACADYKQAMRDFIEELVVEAGLDDPALLATSLAILLEGAIVSAQVSRDASAAHHARRTARMLIESEPGA